MIKPLNFKVYRFNGGVLWWEWIIELDKNTFINTDGVFETEELAKQDMQVWASRLGIDLGDQA